MLARLQTSAVYRLYQKWAADQVGDLAILIAWTALLSMFPLLLALHALVGLLVRDPRVLATVLDAVVHTFPGQAAAAVGEVLETAREGAAERGAIGLAGLVFAGSALFGSMANAFNHVYRVPGRGVVRQRLMAVSMMVLFSVLVAVSLLANAVANVALAALQGAGPLAIPGWGGLLTAAAWTLSLLTACVLFLAIYRVVPNAGQRLEEVWPGALLAAVLFFLLSQAFPLYLRLFGDFGQYAIFGLFFLVMTWFYFLAQVLLLGVELNAFLSRPWLRTVAPAPTVAALARARAPAEPAPALPRPARPHLLKRLLFGGLTAGLSWAVVALALLVARALKQ
ncbi:MAG: YihY/virulence factor BrkB family protein [Chloroflexi bacterium]|nr:YihY/virulence factor BrkB family protein [Chloroflexota bacterium]